MSKRFKGQENFEHGRPSGVGILVVNLGTPDAPTPAAVRKYLAEFLSDKRVVEIPQFIWKIILHGIVLRVRPKKSAKAYQRVWSDEGSPLMAGTAGLTRKIDQQMKARYGEMVTTVVAMRYGNPSIQQGLEQLQAKGVGRIIVLPLYPQYSGATTGTVADEVFKQLMRWRWIPELHLMGAYHDDPSYIKAVADSVRQHWQEKGSSDKLLISFHGMPKATLIDGDPYFCQCHKTSRLIAEELQLTSEQWEMAFQSRFGAAEWLKPYAAERWLKLPQEGVKNLTVVCPGFSIDCLETIDEIANEGKEDFIKAGGEHFEYVPCLNDSPDQVMLMMKLLTSLISGWPKMDSNNDAEKIRKETGESLELARAAGASK